jgi:hypothetical protein
MEQPGEILLGKQPVLFSGLLGQPQDAVPTKTVRTRLVGYIDILRIMEGQHYASQAAFPQRLARALRALYALVEHLAASERLVLGFRKEDLLDDLDEFISLPGA